MGFDGQASPKPIAQRSDLRTYAPTHLRTYGSLSWARRTGNWLLDVTIKHGYQPLRAVGMLLAVYAVALLLLSDP